MLALSGTALSTQQITVHFDNDFRPYSYVQDDELKGLYVTILARAFQKMPRFEVKMQPVQWVRGKRLMEKGKGFALTPVYYHGHDWPYLYPYSLPFYREEVYAICHNEVKMPANSIWPKDFKGKIFGNIKGYDGWGGDAFREMVNKGDIDLAEVASTKSVLQMLINRRFDCVLLEKSTYEFEKKILTQKIGKTPHPFHLTIKTGEHDVYIGYSATGIDKGDFPYAKEFQQEFDNVIFKMKRDGEIAAITKAYLKAQ